MNKGDEFLLKCLLAYKTNNPKFPASFDDMVLAIGALVDRMNHEKRNNDEEHYTGQKPVEPQQDE